MKTITSSSNPRIKSAIKLHSSRGRKESNRIIIFGQRELRRAVESGLQIEELFVCKELIENDALEYFVESKADNSYFLPETLFERIAYGDRVDGVIAIASRPSTDLHAIEIAQDSLVVIIEQIEKPGNVGAIVRTADAAGADAVIVADKLTDPYHPNSIRASLGSIFSMPIAVAETKQVIGWAVDNDFEIFAAIVGSDTVFYQANLCGKIAIVLGNEAEGLSEQWLGRKIGSVQLPMLGISDSLNVSNTAAVLLYEAQRQRDSQ